MSEHHQTQSLRHYDSLVQLPKAYNPLVLILNQPKEQIIGDDIDSEHDEFVFLFPNKKEEFS